MAEKRTTPETPQNAAEDAGPGARRKKRAGPTIDLTATEVPPAHEAAPPPPDPPPSAAPDPPAAPADSPLGSRINTGTYIAGAAGALAMTLILAALWLTGLLPVRYATAPGAMDTKSIDALAQRVGKIEDTVAKLPAGDAGMADRLAAADNAMKSLGIALTALNRRSDDNAGNANLALARADAASKAVTELRTSVQEAAKNGAAGISPAELDALQKRLAALEQSAKTTHEDIGRAATADNAARLALSAAALRDAVLSGAPFTAELAQAKSLGASDKEMAPLAPFAAIGVPSAPALAQELRTLLPAILKISGAQAPPDGFFERLEANAGKLVRIRPIDAPPGDDVPAVLARIEIDTAKADVPAALTDLGKLADATRAPAQVWIAKAKLRQAALAAARRYAADTARALGPSSGPKAGAQ
jgi:hypothetical protein